MFGAAYFGVTHYGPAYFPPGDIVIEVPDVGSGAGGNYGSRTLPTIADYEKRIKKVLDEERAQLLNEAKQLKKNLVKREVKRLLADQQEKIRLQSEYELQLAVVSESLLQVERDLAEIDSKRAKIKLRARIMRDDDEVMILLYG